MAKGQSLQDPFLNTLRKERIPVSIYLVNGIKLQGQIDSFDQFVVLLKNSVSQMVYKHAISTVVPARNVRITNEDGNRCDPVEGDCVESEADAARRPFPDGLGDFLATYGNTGRGRSHALQFEVNRRFARGFMFNVSYTLLDQKSSGVDVGNSTTELAVARVELGGRDALVDAQD